MKKEFLIVVILWMANLIGMAQGGTNPYLSFQNLINVTTTSPEAASLGKFGNVPVSYCTGIPSISIPIYEINIGSIKLPVSLDYHAGGIRIDETSSGVGTGWALGGIGIVSRNMIGLPDELAGTGFIGAPNPDAVVANPGAYVTYLYSLKNGFADAEPDIFQYTLGGQSGKFIFNRDGTIMQIPKTNNKIAFSGQVVSIVDENGVKYIFDQGFTTQSISSLGPSYISTWRLSKMIASNGTDEIVFRYDMVCNGSIEHQKNVSYTIGVTSLSCKRHETGIPGCDKVDDPTASLGSEMKTNTQTIVHNDSYINEIDWRGGKMVFTNSCDRQDVTGSGEQLKQVDIYALANGAYTLSKSFKLFHSYFFSNPINNSATTEKNYRLRLDSVGVFSTNAGDKPQVYSMNYDNSPIAPRESGLQDRWGFYNPSGSLMPYQVQLYTSAIDPTNGLYYEFGTGTNETDAAAMHACTLNSIKYPTGGQTVFTMEPHQYHTSLPQKATRTYACNAYGGLQSSNQVKFTVNDPNAAGFYYRVNISAFGSCTTTGGGCPSDRPRVTFYDQTANQTLMVVGTPPGSEKTNFSTGTIGFKLISGHTYVITSNIYGATNQNVNITTTIGWTYTLPAVDEIKLGGGQRIKAITNYDTDGKFISAENYKYGTDGTGLPITPQYYQDINFEKVVNLLECYLPETPCSADWNHFENDYNINPAFGYSLIFHSNSILPTSQYCGSPVLYPLVTKYQVDANGNPNGKTVYNYNVFQDDGFMTNTPIVDPTPLNVPSTGINLISNAWKNGLLASEETHKSTSAGYSLIAKMEYAYNTSFGRELTYVLKMKNKYLVSSNYIGEQSPFSAPRDFNLTSVPIITGSVLLRSETETTYDANGNSVVSTVNYNYNDPTHFFPTSKQMINSKGETITENLKYPNDFAVKGNVYDKMITRNIISPVIQSTKLKNSNQLSFTAINYNDWFSNSALLLHQTVQQQTGNNSVETRINYNRFDTYGNILEQQKPGDVKEVYLWGYSGQYPVARIIGSDYNTVNTVVSQSQIESGTSNDAGLRSILNVLRTDSRTSKALVTTYTYKPLVGITSETDPNGKTTYYEYDSFNRLKNIKDYQGNIIKNFQYNYSNAGK